jgi:hypothetical protein
LSAFYDPKITVCKTCWRASCWEGWLVYGDSYDIVDYMCSDAGYVGTTEIPVSTLVLLSSEHPDWWNKHLKRQGEPLLTAVDLRRHGVTDRERLELSR